jgi:hypothetical protein
VTDPETPAEPVSSEPPGAHEGPEAPEADDTLMERMFPTVERSRDRWLELIAAILLALATVMSAWSAYQATRWSGVQATSFSRAGALRSESVRASTRGGQQISIDVQSFIAWVNAMGANHPREAAFLQARFRDEFKPAFRAWILTAVDSGKSVPPGTPFDLPEYAPAEMQKAQQLEKEAAASFEVATDANQTGDNFVLTAVLFASVLFFAGIGTKWRSFRLRVSSLAVGGLMFLTATAIAFSLPQNVGF